MTPERQQRVKELFEAALVREPGERAAYLQSCCQDDSLRAEVESLLLRAAPSHGASQKSSPAPGACGGSIDCLPSTLAPGQVLASRFRIERFIGRGGMGDVYLAHDEKLDREVAVKIVPSDALTDGSVRKRLRREARALSKLSHPNIESLIDFHTEGDIEFLVVEYVEGETLSDKLSTGPLPEKEVARLGAQLAVGLAAAHDRNVVHRDLKPGNLRVTSDGRLKILDFGIAKVIKPPREAVGVTSTTDSSSGDLAVAGTLPYMAPEQLRSLPTDPRTDIYAAGTVLYEMATGQRPFAEEAAPALIDDILHAEPVSPRARNARVSPEIERIILKCLQKEPENRYHSARDLEVDLRQVATPDTGKPIPSRPVTIARHRRTLTVLVVAGAIAAAGFAVNLGGVRDWLLGAGNPPRIQSIAVLPLENLSGDLDQEYFADGMTDLLITDLSKISALEVISRTSVMQYKGARRPLPEIAAALKVQGVVEGTVQQFGSRVRISAKLIDARTDKNVWGDIYEGDVRDVLSLQSEVARTIAQEIRVQLTSQDLSRLASGRPVNSDAFLTYLKGRYYWEKRDADGLTKAIDYFKRAIELDPTYALAYDGLADSYNALGSDWFLPPNECFPKAKASALKALEIDPNLAQAHASLAFALWNYYYDWKAVEDEYTRALDLDPGYPTTYHWYSGYLASMGRFQEAISAIQKARQLDPLSDRIDANLGFILYLARQYDQATTELLKIKPGNEAAYAYLGMALLQKGANQRAVEAFERHNQMLAGKVGTDQSLAYAYAKAGRRVEAQRLLLQSISESKTRYEPAILFARVYEALGEKDMAFSWLEKAYDERSSPLALLNVDPTFDDLRSDPRFKALLERMNLRP